MRPSFYVLYLWIILALAIGSGGCATIRTMPSLSSAGHPKVYSGARLDFHAIMGDEPGLNKFRARPPKYPWIDFPLSLILDTAILPITFPVATYELLFES